MTEQEQNTYDHFLAELETLVNTDSATENKDGVADVAEILKKRLEDLGLEAKITFEGKDRTPCLKACTASKNGRFDFMFLGHMDTVFPTGEAAKRPFSTKDGHGLGPGVSDMKGGLLVALYVVEQLKERGLLDKIAICIAFNGDEEIGSPDSRPWIEKTSENCDRVFVFEPCRLEFRHVLHRKGGGRVKITAKGISSHAGADPEKGANALVELASHIPSIHALNDLDGDITAQCTVIRSGEKTNIIPDEAVLDVDVRVGTKEEMKIVENFFNELPNKNYVENTSIEITGGVDRPPMEYTDKTVELWNVLAEEGRKLGLDPAYISTGGCSDGNWTAARGITTIDGMGTVGANSHREDEYTELKSIIPAITMITNTCIKTVLGD
ncbi:M20 family metallopeptidase [Maridesulfovibrio zosterae]|uniref:M20 family metallopeptidase n=1 Tax=Maridesulfovibrio zosterae TaxID=82171 RepID=UPI0003F7B968|nr:M20 family metallopeptidase [Maridesulfovibrio zosterae]